MNNALDEYLFSEVKNKVDNTEEWFIMSSPITILAILMVYLGFVLKIGPDLMKNRSPFELRLILVAYNILQVGVSFFVFYIGTNVILQNGLIFQQQCTSDSVQLKISTITVIYFYFYAKLSELLDTVFFVLRKRDRQISFLHVYHHSFALVISWYILVCEPAYNTVFLCSLNSFVHIIMYTYYGLAAFPNLTKYLWWKKYITKMQLVQFFLMVIQMVLSHLFSNCKMSYVLLVALMLNILFFMYLFSRFYAKEYLKNDKSLRSTNKNTINEKNY